MKIFKIVLISLYLVIITFSESVYSSTAYNIPKLGEINYVFQAGAFGRGGTAIAIRDGWIINTINPAGLIYVNITRISSAFYSESIDASTANEDGKYHNYNLRNISLAIPIITNKLVASVGIKPVTTNEFFAETDDTLITGNAYTRKIENDGGLNQASLAIAAAFRKKIFLGISLNQNFGKVTETNKKIFVSSSYGDALYESNSTMWGSNFTIGLMAEINSKFSIGGIYQHSINLTLNDKKDSKIGVPFEAYKRKMKIPYLAGFGMSYVMKDIIRFSSDFVYRPWDGLKIDGKEIENIGNGYNFSAGVEKLPTIKKIAPYFKKITLRAGFSLAKLNYEHKNGEQISEYMGMIGMGLPFYKGWGRIDMGLGYGKRGDFDKNPIEETFLKFMLSVSGGEKWFLRPRR